MVDKSEKELIEELKTAREHGDLKENAEYHAAREALALKRSKDQAKKEALEAEKKAKQEHKQEKNAALQELLNSGMTMDQIKMTMPWMIEG